MSAEAPVGTFAEVTAVTATGDGRFAARVDPDWATPRGANGGVLAAVVLRAMVASVADEAKHPRSLTCHYLTPPAPGPVELEVRTLREGRAVATLEARLTQDGAPCVAALGAFGVPLDSALDYADLRMPDVPSWTEVEPVPDHPKAPPIARRLEVRPLLGPAMFSHGDEARTGGWIRTREPTPADPVAVALYTDGWLPAPFVRLGGPVGAPTIDLTVHLRRPLPHPGPDPCDPVLIDVVSRTSADGYMEEDTAIWASDGTLLAQSRQLALLRPGA